MKEFKLEGDHAIVKRALEDGYEELKVKLPCVLTCIKELNTPRYMSVPGILKGSAAGDQGMERGRHRRGYDDRRSESLPDQRIQIVYTEAKGSRRDGSRRYPEGKGGKPGQRAERKTHHLRGGTETMANFEEYKNVWVFAEQRQGKLMNVALELVGEGHKLSREISAETKVCAVLVGDQG